MFQASNFISCNFKIYFYKNVKLSLILMPLNLSINHSVFISKKSERN